MTEREVESGLIDMSSLTEEDVVRARWAAITKVTTWEYDPGTFTIWPKAHPYYRIKLETMASSAAVLDWIAQVSTKSWASYKMLGEMVRLLDAILSLQGNYCSFQHERGPVDVKQIALRRLGPRRES